MDGQLIVVHYNNRKNAHKGERNKHTIINVESKLDIAQMINDQLAIVKEAGYVLVKYANCVYLCEQNNLDPKKPYRKYQIKYHPFVKEFTIWQHFQGELYLYSKCKGSSVG